MPSDTYNHKIKRIDPDTRTIETLRGGVHGWRDGSAPLFYEPSDLDVAGGVLYVADTNNHAVRAIDLLTGETRTLVLQGIGTRTTQELPGKTVRLPPVDMGAGQGTIVLDVILPEGYKVNELTTSSVAWEARGKVLAFEQGERLPLEIVASLRRGQGQLVVPITVHDEGEHTLTLVHRVELPALDVP